LGLEDSGFARIRAAHPLEVLAEQSITFAAWHDVDVQVRHALRNSDVEGNERALRVQSGLHRARDALHDQEERSDLVGWQVLERGVVGLRYDEDVTG